MSDKISLHICLDSRYCKYLLKRYRIDENVVALSRKDPEGHYLHTLLRLRNPGNPNFGKSKSNLEIILPDPYGNKKLFLGEKQFIDFRLYLDNLLRREMMDYISIKNKLTGMHVDKLIREFKQLYDLTEMDWSFEAIKKYYYRNIAELKPALVAA